MKMGTYWVRLSYIREKKKEKKRGKKVKRENAISFEIIYIRYINFIT